MGRQVSIQVSIVMIDYRLSELLSEVPSSEITQTVIFLLDIFAASKTDFFRFRTWRTIKESQNQGVSITKIVSSSLYFMRFAKMFF
jgi:hypothetical protein